MGKAAKTIPVALKLQEGVRIVCVVVQEMKKNGKLQHIDNVLAFERLLLVACKGLEPVCENADDFRKYVRDFLHYHCQSTPACNGTFLEFVKLNEALFTKPAPEGPVGKWILKNKEVLTTISPWVISGTPVFITLVTALTVLISTGN